MANTTNVPSIEFTQTGLVLPEDAAILSGAFADTNDAFGGNLNTALETPQGQIVSSLSAIVSDKNSQFAYFVNQVNPDYAEGFMQDAIARIYFLARKPAISTSVQCDCMGAVGTIIPVGAQAKDTSGNLYLCTQAGTIPITGIITLPFDNIVSGPISCPAGTLNQIYQAISGWDTINNTSNGVPGALVESRADFAYRRQNSVALNSHGSLSAVYSAVFNVPDVIDVYAAENTTNIPIFLGATNYSLEPHSLYIAAVGGTSTDIAQAILDKKDAGSNTNGNTVINVIIPINSLPYPAYPIRYNIPSSLPILFNIQLDNNNSLPSDIVTKVKNSIIAAFTGSDGGQRARIGSTIYASRFYAPVSLSSSGVSIVSILIGTAIANLNFVEVGVDQFPTVVAENITVTLV
jgi:uncharacterized phage protein gp47/JayE